MDCDVDSKYLGVKIIYVYEILISSAWRQKGLTGYCFKYIDRPFCLQSDDMK